MEREFLATGKTVEEAIEAAYEKAGVDREYVTVEIIERPKKKFFGLKTVPATAKAVIDEDYWNKMFGVKEKKEEAPKPKKVKKNLRVGKNKEEKSYTDKNKLLEIASMAFRTNQQKNEVSLEKDAERNRKKIFAEQRKVEKRQARLDRKKEKEEKLKQEAMAKSLKKKKKN